MGGSPAHPYSQQCYLILIRIKWLFRIKRSKWLFRIKRLASGLVQGLSFVYRLDYLHLNSNLWAGRHRSDLFEPPWVRVGCGSGQEKGQNLPTGNLWAGHPRTPTIKLSQNMMKIWYIKTKTFFRITESPTEWLKDRATDRLSDDQLTYQPTDWLTT